MDSPEHGMDSIEGLEERLQNANNAFESILALTPAPEYFGSQIADGKDPSEQWNRKKQTAAEKRAAKKAKLDPANQKSALDIMKERERKRKRELGIAEDETVEGEKAEKDGESRKRQKGEVDEAAEVAKRKAKAEKRKEKRHAKQEKVAAKKAKVEAKKAAKEDQDLEEAQPKSKSKKQQPAATADDDEEDSDAEEVEQNGELDGFDASGLAGSDNEEDVDDDASDASSAPSTPAVESPPFDVSTNHSTASSASSTIPPSKIEKSSTAKKDQRKPSLKLGTVPAIPSEAAIKASDLTSGTSSPKIQLPDIDTAELQERLRQRIEALRAARKADGPEGKPARSRTELLEQRRKKEEQRKAAKKEQRRKQKEEEQTKQEAQLRGSGSPLSGDIFNTRSPAPQENNFSFSRLAFEDGTAADASLSTLTEARKAKGRSDPATALLAAQNKQKRIAGYDAEKRADIAEKDLWLNAKKRAHGERVRDDTSLLKKALKRKEKAKSKSEAAWRDREEAVTKGKELKQKRRETNLAKRKEEKGSKGKKKGPPKGGKKKGRPGFEGRFKA